MRQIKSVEIFRVIGILCVISGHTLPFHSLESESEIYWYLCVGINQIVTRFVLPFFMIISGYFWGIKVIEGRDPISYANQMAKKVGIIFVVWSIIYLMPYNFTVGWEYGILGPVKVAYWSALRTLSDPPIRLLMQGTKQHLWFLVSLICSVYITAIFVKNRLFVALITLSIFLYIFGVLAKAYELTPIGLEAHFNTRDGPFFGTVSFATGYFMARLNPNSKWLYYGLFIFCIGLGFQLLEVMFLWQNYGLGPIHDYVFATYFMGLGVAVLSLSNHPKLQFESLSSLGQLTLGIYTSHFIFVDLLRGIDDKINHPAWELSNVVIVFILSIALTKLLSKVKWLRKSVI